MIGGVGLPDFLAPSWHGTAKIPQCIGAGVALAGSPKSACVFFPDYLNPDGALIDETAIAERFSANEGSGGELVAESQKTNIFSEHEKLVEFTEPLPL